MTNIFAGRIRFGRRYRMGRIFCGLVSMAMIDAACAVEPIDEES